MQKSGNDDRESRFGGCCCACGCTFYSHDEQVAAVTAGHRSGREVWSDSLREEEQGAFLLPSGKIHITLFFKSLIMSLYIKKFSNVLVFFKSPFIDGFFLSGIGLICLFSFQA